MRLTLVISCLRGGGGERTASVLAGAWAAQGTEITLITLTTDDSPAYTLHPAIRLRQLRVLGGKSRNIFHKVLRLWRTVWTLRSAIGDSRPDLIVSVMDVANVLTLFAARRGKRPVIIMEQTHPDYHRIGWIWETLRRLIYRSAGMLVCPSTQIMEVFRQKTRAHACVIPNPVDLPRLQQRIAGSPPGGRRSIIGMGRLAPEKGFDLLLEAFSRIAASHPDWSLRIMGEGPLHEKLQAQSQALGIASRVEWMGWQQDPSSVLRAADLFVFSSHFEGFGNALCEAMACGLPVISFDCPSGPREIIRHQVDGLLVPPDDVTALAAAMDRLMSDPQERMRLAARAPEVVERFGLTRVLGLWDHLFAGLLPKS
jgi:glycosyltransferase involved in cell wall biosynthesis